MSGEQMAQISPEDSLAVLEERLAAVTATAPGTPEADRACHALADEFTRPFYLTADFCRRLTHAALDHAVLTPILEWMVNEASVDRSWVVRPLLQDITETTDTGRRERGCHSLMAFRLGDAVNRGRIAGWLTDVAVHDTETADAALMREKARDAMRHIAADRDFASALFNDLMTVAVHSPRSYVREYAREAITTISDHLPGNVLTAAVCYLKEGYAPFVVENQVMPGLGGSVLRKPDHGSCDLIGLIEDIPAYQAERAAAMARAAAAAQRPKPFWQRIGERLQGLHA